MSEENFWLARYKAILNKDLIKSHRFSKFTDQEKENYLEESPELSFDIIFTKKNPMSIINSLLGSKEFKDFAISLTDLDHPSLATEENILIRDKNELELLKHPLIDYSPNPYYGPSVIESILSITYSTIFTTEEINKDLMQMIEYSPILKDVLSVAAKINHSSNNDNSFWIALIGEDMNEYNPTLDAAGGYHPIFNKLIATSENLELNYGIIIHELSHMLAERLYENNNLPYNDIDKNEYDVALKNTLLNIGTLIKQKFNLYLMLENENNSYSMGKTLATIFFPQYLDKNNSEYYISLLKKHNLDINDKLPWLGEESSLEFALSYYNFELADALIEHGAYIDQDMLSRLNEHDDEELLNWIAENQLTIDYTENNLSNEFTDHQISLQEDTLPLLEALNCLLKFYYHEYDQNEEPSESFVAMPEIIASGLYQGDIIEVLEPQLEYWQRYITPKIEEYLYNDYIDICLLSPEHYDYS